MMEEMWDLVEATRRAGMGSREIAELWLGVVSPEAADIIRSYLKREDAKVGIS